MHPAYCGPHHACMHTKSSRLSHRAYQTTHMSRCRHHQCDTPLSLRISPHHSQCQTVPHSTYQPKSASSSKPNQGARSHTPHGFLKISPAVRPYHLPAQILMPACVHVCAHSSQRGLTPLLLEASDAVGGRVRTDMVEGFTLDRGFQIFLTGGLSHTERCRREKQGMAGWGSRDVKQGMTGWGSRDAKQGMTGWGSIDAAFPKVGKQR